jgi:hypothetical protein
MRKRLTEGIEAFSSVLLPLPKLFLIFRFIFVFEEGKAKKRNGEIDSKCVVFVVRLFETLRSFTHFSSSFLW